MSEVLHSTRYHHSQRQPQSPSSVSESSVFQFGVLCELCAGKIEIYFLGWFDGMATHASASGVCVCLASLCCLLAMKPMASVISVLRRQEMEAVDIVAASHG